MSEPANNPPPRNRKRRWIVIVLLAFGGGLTALCLWFAGVTIGDSDPLFRGKPESEWIRNLEFSDGEQVKEWRTYGEEGVQVLIRGLERAQRENGTGKRTYRRLHGQLPGFLRQVLPWPKSDSTRGTRQLICALIRDLGKDAQSAVPVMSRTLRDEDPVVRLFALIFFGSPPNGESVLSLMNEKERAQVLPDLIRVMQESPSARLNGLHVLKYFPEHKEIVTPLLLACLQDTNSATRVLAAYSLYRVDPMAAKDARATAIVVEIAKKPTNTSAAYAVQMLGKFNHEPEAAVSALVECLQSTNTSIACEAVWALEWSPKEFKNYSDMVVPALTKAAERKDNVGGYAKVALKRFQFDGDPTQAIK